MEDSPDHRLLADLWDFLEGDEKKTIKIEDLRVVLLILIGVKPPGRVKKPENEAEQEDEAGPNEEGDEPKQKPDTFYEGGNLYIRAGKTQKVFIRFKNLYINKIEAHGRTQLAKQAQPAPVPEE